jgi:hypothetical protein
MLFPVGVKYLFFIEAHKLQVHEKVFTKIF